MAKWKRCGLQNRYERVQFPPVPPKPGWWNGIHARLKIVCHKACGFESRPGHNKTEINALFFVIIEKMDQFSKKIKIEEALNKKFYPSWFFTNEKIGDFLSIKNNKIKKGFCIGGGGDFVFNLFSFFAAEEISVCDTRPVACMTIDLKRAILKKFSLEEVKEIFSDYKKENKEEVYNKIKEDITPLSKQFYDKLFQASNKNFIISLKNSGHWYKDSFWQFKKDYLFYLQEENYSLLKKNIKNIKICYGDFKGELDKSEDNFYDLVYISNILDSKKDCHDKEGLLETIERKLKTGGVLVLATQENVQKIVKEVEFVGLRKKDIKIHRFKLITLFTKHYSYSFVVFEK